MRSASLTQVRAAVADAQALLCDWDGCLAIGDQLLPGVAAFLAEAPPVAIVSNNSTMPRALYRERLLAQGVDVPMARIHLAGDTLLRMGAEELAGQSIQLIAAPEMREEARRMGLRLVDQGADAVLLMRDVGFDFARLARAANDVRRGAHFWCANQDGSHPVHGGITPETGALAAAISAAAGRAPDRIIGKPDSLLFRAALAALGVSGDRALMIGDNPDTDLTGARAMGMPALLVGPDSWQGSA